MRAISLIVVHCSATREDKSFTEHDLDVCHRRRGFNGTVLLRSLEKCAMAMA